MLLDRADTGTRCLEVEPLNDRHLDSGFILTDSYLVTRLDVRVAVVERRLNVLRAAVGRQFLGDDSATLALVRAGL